MEKSKFTKEQIQEKVKGGSGWLSVVLALMGCFMIALSVATLMGALKLHGQPGNTEAHIGLSSLLARSFNGLFYAAVLFTLTVLFRNIKNTGTPFTDTVIKKLYIISGLMFASSVLSPVFAIIAAHLMEGNANYRVIFSDMGFGVVLALIMLALAWIFRYGTMLQQESDETL